MAEATSAYFVIYLAQGAVSTCSAINNPSGPILLRKKLPQLCHLNKLSLLYPSFISSANISWFIFISDNIYSQAIHYIGVRESELVDLRGNSRISVAEKPRILLTNQLGKVVTVNKPQNCIAIQDMKFRCIKNPSLCEKTGFTFALWLRNRGNNEQYIAYGIRAHKGSGIIVVFLNERQIAIFIDS